jgi:MoaA/NifB/PqqE/SkfB family radical SAM enzyme
MKPPMSGVDHTYCPRLWDSLYVERDGHVYTCCHLQPARLGNLHRSSLREISQAEPLRRFRRASLEGRLECFAECTLLPPDQPPSPAGLGTEGPYEDFRWLQILFSEYCTISCVMCWQDHDDRTSLSAETLMRQADLAPFAMIEIQGGEPLVIPEAKKFFDIAAAAGKKVSFLTNGLPISEEWAEKIARHSTQLHVSLNAATKEMHEFVNRGSSWERVWKNIDRVKAWRAQLKSPVVVLGHFTIFIFNLGEVPSFIETFRDSFDELNFCYDHRLPAYLDERPKIRAGLKRRLRALPGGLRGVSAFGVARLSALGLL